GSARVIVRLRACWTTQAPSGWAVKPARCTRRLWSSMKNSDVDPSKGHRLDGEEVAGDQARRLLAKEYAPREAHPPRPGGTPRRRRRLRTAVSDTDRPSFLSSPTIRR